MILYNTEHLNTFVTGYVKTHNMFTGTNMEFTVLRIIESWTMGGKKYILANDGKTYELRFKETEKWKT